MIGMNVSSDEESEVVGYYIMEIIRHSGLLLKSRCSGHV